ncbi:MAG TPA: hypothetical protein C5S50_06125 [Methanosarcinaceae archaeon]|nr:hypothetical protein [Methanosarcinaceae archaeon]
MGQPVTPKNDTSEMVYEIYLTVISNLENEGYVKTVLCDVDDLVRELQNMEDEELQEAKQLIRKFSQHPLVRYDVR